MSKPTQSKMATKPVFPGAFELFKPSLEVLKRNPRSFLWLLIIPALLLMIGEGPGVFNTTPDFSFQNAGGFWDIIGLVGAVATLLTLPGVLLLELHGARKKKLEAEEAFSSGLAYFWKLIGLIICMLAIFVVSIILLIVPFFFALRRYILAPYYLIDRNLGIFEALHTSARESKQFTGAIWGVIGVSVLINFATLLPYIGLIVAVVLGIIYSVAPALRYLQIKAAVNGKPPTTPIEKAIGMPAPEAS